MKEVDAANLILGKAGSGDRFRIKWGLLTLRLSIRPLSARQVVKVSREVAHIPGDIDLEKDMFVEQMNQAEGLRYVCRAIALSTRTRFKRIVARAISKLPLKDVQFLWNLVRKQSDPESFFFIMISAKGMNKMKKVKKPAKLKEEKRSSEESPL